MSQDNHKEIIAIGDIHGRKLWRRIVEKNPEAHIVFMGDYCDPYEYIGGGRLLNNLNGIINLKHKEPDRITLLLGNHDMHYITNDFSRGTRYDNCIADELKYTLQINRNDFCYAWQYRNLLFTHSGVSKHWLETIFKKDIYPNAAYVFNNTDITDNDRNALFACGKYRGGDDAYGGIFWADIREFDSLPEGFIQIAGHNRVTEIRHFSSADVSTDTCADIFVCDCLVNFKYLRITIDNDDACFYEMDLEDDSSTLLAHKYISSE